MQKITVASIETKKSKDGTKEFYTLTDTDKAQYTSFDSQIVSLPVGSIIELEPVIKGNYINIKEWKKISVPTISESPKNAKTEYIRADNPAQRTSIERQCCLKCAWEFTNAPDATIEQVLANAQKMWEWVSGDKGGRETSRRAGSTSPEAEKQAVKAEEKKEPAKSQGDNDNLGGKTIQESPKTMTEFSNRCRDAKINMKEAYKIIGVSSYTEIADVGESWAKVQKHLESQNKKQEAVS